MVQMLGDTMFNYPVDRMVKLHGNKVRSSTLTYLQDFWGNSLNFLCLGKYLNTKNSDVQMLYVIVPITVVAFVRQICCNFVQFKTAYMFL
jgi:hypothetical protein